ncbi:hypothetical protein ACDZ29_23395 [Peribacillus sp. RS7]|uniref:hypothetical protein n=1 Tax=Peribacillus sp. RS7 TaxID=3242679 RepID=UPI0035C0CA64
MGKYKTFSVLIFTLFITFSAGNAASASNWALIGGRQSAERAQVSERLERFLN